MLRFSLIRLGPIALLLALALMSASAHLPQTHRVRGTDATPTIVPTPIDAPTPTATPVACTVNSQQDTDCDGCVNVRELGSDVRMGGLRNPNSFWDYFDTPDNNGVRNHLIRVDDVTRVVNRYLANDANGTAAINRYSDPLSVPASAGYYPAFDRGPPVGPYRWELGPADGKIDVADVVAVVNQYRHDCVVDVRPNFLIIVTDDQRYDTMGYMPITQARIFDQGVAFSNAFVTTSLCCPSRSSILTGMYAHTHAVHNNPDPLTKTTFVQRLQETGYYTGLVGKYLNSWDFTQPRPEFNYWASNAPGGTEYYNARIEVNGLLTTAPYSTTALQQYALTFLNQAAGQQQPFMLYFAPNAPHLPALPATEDQQLYSDLPPFRPPNYNEPDVSDKPHWLQNQPQLTQEQRDSLDTLRLNQLRSLASVDRAIGAILDLLAQRGQLDNTVIVFISDNGHFWGEHRLDGKVFVYEPSIRVPFAIRYPRLVQANTVKSDIVANIDIAPTLYELAGMSIPSDVDGQSLVPLLQGTGSWRKDILIEAWPGPRHFAAVHTDRYVYVENDGDLSELYDLVLDPYQLNNSVSDPAYAGLVDDLRQRLHQLEGPQAAGVPTPRRSSVDLDESE